MCIKMKRLGVCSAATRMDRKYITSPVFLLFTDILPEKVRPARVKVRAPARENSLPVKTLI